MAGRTPNTIESDNIHPSLPKPAIRSLELLLKSGRYGTNVSDVARYLLMRSNAHPLANLLKPEDVTLRDTPQGSTEGPSPKREA